MKCNGRTDMENVEHFGTLTERMKEFREEVLDEKPYIDAQRAILATLAYKENLNQPRVMVRAKMLEKVLDHMSIYIEDKSLLAGNQATKNRNAPIFPEYTMEFVMNELNQFEKRDGDVFYITEKTKEQLREIAPFWQNNNLRARGEALLPEEVRVFMETGVFGMEGKLNAGDAHLAVNYERILKDGLRGYEKRVKEYKATLDLTDPESIDKYCFYNAVLIVLEAVRNFANRYSVLAKDLAEKELNQERKIELLEISRICSKVPYEPAETFQEAVQSVWFIQLILQIESNGHSLSYGRFDQYMYPYYDRDIKNGTIKESEALELLTCLWIKTLTINKVRSQAHTLSSAGSPMYQNVTIAGQTIDKKDAVNDLSFLVLKSVAQTRLTQPNLTVRYHKNINKRFTKGYGYFTEMESYEELLKAWDKTIREITRYSVIVENVIDKASERDVPDILCSALTDDCIARGKTIKEGGAVYDFISGLQVGIANMADCLAAIKKLVYEEKKITRQELWNAILDDFSSPENKKIQEMLIREAPKYGNDDDYVDQLIVEAYDSYIEEIEKYPNTRYNRGPIGGIRYAGTSSISANVGQGMSTMATPDGRNAFEPLAEGCSPAHNSDKNGPTAVFKSVSKLRTNKITGGVLLNQKMTPQMLSTEENRQKLELLIKTFFNRLHGYHVQYNIVSKETLIDAQKHPEKHKDLIVRVAGYSAFFNVLSKKTQDDIIGRTEQSLM